MGWALGAGLQLAVRERARAAHAVLDVALHVQLSGGVVRLHDPVAAGGVVPALHEQGRKARPREGERAEEARAAGSHHNGTRVGRHGGVRPAEGLLVHHADALLGVGAGQLGEDGRLLRGAARELRAQGEGEHDVGLLARVDGATATLDAPELRRVDAQLLGERLFAEGELALVTSVELREVNPYA